MNTRVKISDGCRITYLSLKTCKPPNPKNLTSSWLLVVHWIVTRVIPSQIDSFCVFFRVSTAPPDMKDQSLSRNFLVLLAKLLTKVFSVLILSVLLSQVGPIKEFQHQRTNTKAIVPGLKLSLKMPFSRIE